jgi:GNAT superfamily N-acetyltransferase
MIRDEGFDPSLYFLACEGDEVVGITLGRLRDEAGWVRTVGVRRPWRRQGVAMALLLTAFRAFYDRGIHVVGLGVDAQSLTGATRVYERAGMHVRTRYDAYQKIIHLDTNPASHEPAIAHTGA